MTPAKFFWQIETEPLDRRRAKLHSGRCGGMRAKSSGAIWDAQGLAQPAGPSALRSSLKSPRTGGGAAPDAGGAGPPGQALARSFPGRVGIAGDVKAPQARRENKRRKVARRQGRDHGDGEHHRPSSDSTVSMPSPATSTSPALPKRTAVAKETPERTARRGDRRLAASGGMEPGAQDARDVALKIGNGGNRRGLASRGALIVDAGKAPRVKAQGGRGSNLRDLRCRR